MLANILSSFIMKKIQHRLGMLNEVSFGFQLGTRLTFNQLKTRFK